MPSGVHPAPDITRSSPGRSERYLWEQTPRLKVGGPGRGDDSIVVVYFGPINKR